jgi:hypothetical protein
MKSRAIGLLGILEQPVIVALMTRLNTKTWTSVLDNVSGGDNPVVVNLLKQAIEANV